MVVHRRLSRVLINLCQREDQQISSSKMINPLKIPTNIDRSPYLSLKSSDPFLFTSIHSNVLPKRYYINNMVLSNPIFPMNKMLKISRSSRIKDWSPPSRGLGLANLIYPPTSSSSSSFPSPLSSLSHRPFHHGHYYLYFTLLLSINIWWAYLPSTLIDVINPFNVSEINEIIESTCTIRYSDTNIREVYSQPVDSFLNLKTETDRCDGNSYSILYGGILLIMLLLDS